MSDVREHHQQSEHNQQLIDQLPAGFPDWQVTLRFYVALHLVNAWLVRNNYPQPKTHAETREVLKGSRFDARLLRRYNELEHWSRIARYDCEDLVTIADLIEPAQETLDQIRAFVLKWIQSDL